MNVLKYRVSLDMFDTHSQITIKAKKGDSACQIHITLTEKGKIYNIGEGCYATFNAKKADGNFIYDKCTIEGNTIVYDFSSSVDKDGVCQVSAREGIVECEVTLYNAGSKQLTSPRFTLFIDGTVYNGEEIISSTESDVLKKLINETNNLANSKQDRFADVTVNEDESQTTITAQKKTTIWESVDGNTRIEVTDDYGALSQIKLICTSEGSPNAEIVIDTADGIQILSKLLSWNGVEFSDLFGGKQDKFGEYIPDEELGNVLKLLTNYFSLSTKDNMGGLSFDGTGAADLTGKGSAQVRGGNTVLSISDYEASIRGDDGEFKVLLVGMGEHDYSATPKIYVDGELFKKQDKFADISVDNEGSVTLTPSKNIQIATTDDNGRVSLVGKYATLYADYINLHGSVSVLGNLDFGYGNGKISNLGTPTADTDAANKAYVDNSIGDIESALDAIIAIQEQLINGGGTE